MGAVAPKLLRARGPRPADRLDEIDAAGMVLDRRRKNGLVGHGRPDAEFATQVMRSVKAGLPPVGTPAPVKGPTEKRKKCECVICDNEFDAALDSSGRVQCPKCYTTFTPR